MHHCLADHVCGRARQPDPPLLRFDGLPRVVLSVRSARYAAAQTGDTCLLHYEVRLAEDLGATPLDSSFAREQPELVVLGSENMLRGWEELIPQMSVGRC